MADIVDLFITSKSDIKSLLLLFRLRDNSGDFSSTISQLLGGEESEDEDEDLDSLLEEVDVRPYSLIPLSDAIVVFSRVLD